MVNDARYGWRQLRKNPVFTLTALLSLALGIGASVTMFSAFWAVFLKSQPYANADRIVEFVQESGRGAPADTLANLEFLRRYERSFERVASYGFFESATLTGVSDATDLWVRQVSPELFDVLGAKAFIGQTFLPSDFRSDSPQAIVLAYKAWQKQFNSDPKIIGRTVFLNGQSHIVRGVMPRGFEFPQSNIAAWLPDRAQVSDPTKKYIAIVACLRRGVSIDQARAELNRITPDFLRAYASTQSGAKFNLERVATRGTAEYESAFRMLLGATGFLVLLSCLNVASLLLSRAAARRNEFAIRRALGARRLRLVGQVLTESLALAVLSGIAGLALAYTGNRILIHLLPAYLGIPRLEEASLDLAVLGFAILVTFVVALFFGIVPALSLSATRVAEADRQGRTVGGRAFIHSVLLIGEIAIALILFAGSILMVRGFVRLANVDPGFHAAHILTATIPPGHTAKLPREQLTQHYTQLLQVAQSVPGVQQAALTGYLPLGMVHVTLLIYLPGISADEIGIDYHAVSPDYFGVMGIPLLQGRIFDKINPNADQGGVVINRAMAEKYWPDQNPVGQRMSGYPPPHPPNMTVIGVVGNTQARSLSDKPIPEFYEPYQQYLGPAVGTTLVLRTYADPKSVASSLRRAIHRFDPNQVIENERTLDAIVQESISKPRFYTVLLGIFAALALILTLIGVYGVAAYGASRRIREFGIRMALGAERYQLIRMLVRQGLITSLLGIAAGSAGAWALAHLMASLVYGVPVKDPISLGIAAIILIAGSIAAYYLPARRTTKIDPAQVLRQE